MYNPENIFLSKDGGGAGNNWANGYASGERCYEEVMEMSLSKSIDEEERLDLFKTLTWEADGVVVVVDDINSGVEVGNQPGSGDQ